MVRGDEVYREPRYISDVFPDTALDFLNAQAGGDSPFYLGLHFTAPHSPWGRNNHPHETWDGYLSGCPFASTPDEPMHPWQQAGIAPDSPPRRRESLAGYFTAVTEMDRNIGRVLDWLDAAGLAENTLVFFTSDNGMNMGHHGLWGKGNASMPLNLFDTSVKVPAILRFPGRAAEGQVCDDLLSHYDWMPTLLEALGLDDPDAARRPGRSFAPLLRGEPLTGRDDVVVFDEYGPARMVRTRTHKYIHRYPYGPHELYDLHADPQERTNLAGRAEQAALEADLRVRLERWFLQYVDPRLDGARLPVTGRGQHAPADMTASGVTAFVQEWSYTDPARGRGNFPVFRT